MLRVVLAVSLAVAIVGIAGPAIDDARVTRSDHLVRGELAAVEHMVRGLHRNEPAMPMGRLGARRVRTIEVPQRSRTSAAVDRVVIGGVPNGTAPADAEHRDVLSYTRPNDSRTVVRLDGVDLRVARYRNGTLHVAADDAALVLRPGTHRLVFRPVEIEGERAVLVHRLHTQV